MSAHEPFFDLTVIPVFNIPSLTAAMNGPGCSAVISLIDMYCVVVYLARDIQGFHSTIEVCPRSTCTEAILPFHG